MLRSRPRRHQSLFKDRAVNRDGWVYIRSWRRHLPDFSWVSVLSGFWPIVLWLTFLAVLWCLYKSVAVPRWGAPDWPPDNVTTTIYQPFAITSFALALLMVFRTNSSYARWWEARTTWGQVFNVSRNLVRQAAAYMGPEQEAAFQVLCRWSAALGYILMAHLDGYTSVDVAAKDLLTGPELALLASWKHRPNCAGQVLSSIVRRSLQDNPQMQMAMDEQIATYINDAGACERILKTSIPACYTRHTSRFILIWLTFLPVALYDICGWASPGVEAALAFLLIGVENIGIQIEEPFTVLPMEAYCRTIAQNALEVAEQREGLDDSVDYFMSKIDAVNGHSYLPSSVDTIPPAIQIDCEIDSLPAVPSVQAPMGAAAADQSQIEGQKQDQQTSERSTILEQKTLQGASSKHSPSLRDKQESQDPISALEQGWRKQPA